MMMMAVFGGARNVLSSIVSIFVAYCVTDEMGCFAQSFRLVVLLTFCFPAFWFSEKKRYRGPGRVVVDVESALSFVSCILGSSRGKQQQLHTWRKSEPSVSSYQ